MKGDPLAETAFTSNPYPNLYLGLYGSNTVFYSISISKFLTSS